MDRLLTDEEIKNAVYDKPEKGSARWTKIVIPRDTKIAKAQDAKTAHLVAQEIMDKLHALWCDIDRRARNSNSIEWTDGMDDANYELQCVITELEAIKSKWGIE